MKRFSFWVRPPGEKVMDALGPMKWVFGVLVLMVFGLFAVEEYRHRARIRGAPTLKELAEEAEPELRPFAGDTAWVAWKERFHIHVPGDPLRSLVAGRLVCHVWKGGKPGAVRWTVFARFTDKPYDWTLTFAEGGRFLCANIDSVQGPRVERADLTGYEDRRRIDAFGKVLIDACNV